jgi:hypothetical protein
MAKTAKPQPLVFLPPTLLGPARGNQGWAVDSVSALCSPSM